MQCGPGLSLRGPGGAQTPTLGSDFFLIKDRTLSTFWRANHRSLSLALSSSLMDTDDSNAGEGEGEDVASKILSIVGRAVLPAKQTKCKAVSPSKSDKIKRLEEQQGK